MASNVKKNVDRVLFSWPAFIASLAVMYVVSQTDTAARLHGAMFPVVTPFQVTSIRPSEIPGAAGEMGRPASILSGYATIEREECDYVGLRWQLNGNQKSVDVTAFFSDPASVRTNGVQEWKALVVGVTPKQLGNTTAYAKHTCGMFPVSSPFYLPKEMKIPATVVGATALCHNGSYSTSIGSGTCANNGGVRKWLNEEEGVE